MGVILIYLVQRCQTSNQPTTFDLTNWLTWTSSSCSLSQSSHSDRRGLLCSARQAGLAELASLGHQPPTTRTHGPSHHGMTSGNGLNSLLRKWQPSPGSFPRGFSGVVKKTAEKRNIHTFLELYLHKFKSPGSSGHCDRRRWGERPCCACAACCMKVRY